MTTFKKILCAGIWMILGALPVSVWASAGTVTHLSGVLSVKRLDGSTKLLSVKSQIEPGDLLSTEEETYARIKFVDGGEVVMRPDTQLKIDTYAYNEAKPDGDNVLISLFKGGLRAVTGLVGKRNKERVNFQTATATIGIRGTHFGALLCNNNCGRIGTAMGITPANGLHVDVTSGAVEIRNSAGKVLINTGQFGFAGGNNVMPVVVPQKEGAPVLIPGAIAKNTNSGGGLGSDGASDCGFK